MGLGLGSQDEERFLGVTWTATAGLSGIRVYEL